MKATNTEPAISSRLCLEGAAEIRPDTEIMPEHIEQRAPPTGIDVVRSRYDYIPMRMNPDHPRFDDPERLLPLRGPFAGCVRGDDLRFKLDRTFGYARRPDKVRRLRRKAGYIEFISLEAIADFFLMGGERGCGQ
ncbi:hypothetical protein GA0061102_100837 [Rhizobium miluonense]|uniref:Uncharacterized protein n=1 Tax=Rhizobium miluonense TaxID=411945 RepID=A0A1C3V2A1_9HYPH|nr:hypothetical protein GA0061102_100837 [Rhizobium miluonense]